MRGSSGNHSASVPQRQSYLCFRILHKIKNQTIFARCDIMVEGSKIPRMTTVLECHRYAAFIVWRGGFSTVMSDQQRENVDVYWKLQKILWGSRPWKMQVLGKKTWKCITSTKRQHFKTRCSALLDKAIFCTCPTSFKMMGGFTLIFVRQEIPTQW